MPTFTRAVISSVTGFFLIFVVYIRLPDLPMDTVQPTLILTSEQIHQKIRRIAFQIYENNFDETALLIAGISGEGYRLAEELTHELQMIAPFTVDLIRLEVDKTQVSQPTIHSTIDFTDKVIVVVDDVLYTGRTLAFSLQPFLQVPIRKLQVAVLIDRNHPRYPVAADYKGYELSTTISEHVDVLLSDEQKKGVYLR